MIVLTTLRRGVAYTGIAASRVESWVVLRAQCPATSSIHALRSRWSGNFESRPIRWNCLSRPTWSTSSLRPTDTPGLTLLDWISPPESPRGSFGAGSQLCGLIVAPQQATPAPSVAYGSTAPSQTWCVTRLLPWALPGSPTSRLSSDLPQAPHRPARAVSSSWGSTSRLRRGNAASEPHNSGRSPPAPTAERPNPYERPAPPGPLSPEGSSPSGLASTKRFSDVSTEGDVVLPVSGYRHADFSRARARLSGPPHPGEHRPRKPPPGSSSWPARGACASSMAR